MAITIKIIEKFAQFVAQFKYGSMLGPWKLVKNSLYRTLSPEEFLKNKIGVCTDYANFIYDQLNKAGIACSIYCMARKFKNGNLMYHFFPVFEYNKKWYIIEGSWKEEPAFLGLRFYRSLKEAINIYSFLEECHFDDMNLRIEDFEWSRLLKIKASVPVGISRDEVKSIIASSEVVMDNIKSDFEDMSDYCEYWKQRHYQDGVVF